MFEVQVCLSHVLKIQVELVARLGLGCNCGAVIGCALRCEAVTAGSGLYNTRLTSQHVRY